VSKKTAQTQRGNSNPQSQTAHGQMAALCQRLPGMAIPPASGQDAVPDWIHLLPAGEIRTADGRGPYSVKDMDRIIASLEAAGGKLAIDENHSTDLAAPKGGPSPARGWIVALEKRLDGLWGKVDWSQTGKQLMMDHAYRYISPVILHRKDNSIIGLVRAALTNAPNLRGLTALNSEDLTMDKELEARIRDLLDLDDDANVVDAIQALQAASKSNSGAVEISLQAVAKAVRVADDTGGEDLAVAVEALQSAMDDIAKTVGRDKDDAPEKIVKAVTDLADPAKRVDATVIKELQTQISTMSETTARDKAEAVIGDAIKTGKPGVSTLKEHYIARHMADPEGVAKELAALPNLAGTTIPRTTPPKKDGDVALDAGENAVANMMGIDPDDYQKTLAEEAELEEALL